MAVKNIGGLLDRVVGFEQRLEQYYAEIRDRSKNNDIRLLTYYLRRHYHHLPDVLAQYPPALIDDVREIELAHAIPFFPEKEFPALRSSPDRVRGPELLKSAILYDTALVNLYREILDLPLMDQARGLFDGLIHVEQRDIVMLRKMTAMHYF